MAITLVDSTTYNNPEGTSAGGSYQIDVPPGVQDGDYLVLTVYGSTIVTNVPVAWTLIEDNTSSTVLRHEVYHRIANSEPADYTIAASNTSRGSCMVAFRGVDTDSLAQAKIAHGTVIDTAGTDPISAADLTNDTTGAVVLTCRATRNNSLSEVRHASTDTQIRDHGQDNGTNARTEVLFYSGEKAPGTVTGLSISEDGAGAGTGTHSITYNILMAPAGIDPDPTAAGATATANNATVTTVTGGQGNAGQASATATAYNASVKVSPAAGSANATATAQQPSKALAPGIGSAGATATAEDPTASIPGAATAGEAGATGAALDATVTTATGISFVGADNFTSTTSASDISAGIPSGIAVGDLLLVGYGNVGNEAGLGCTPGTGWTVVQESTAGTNCYFVVLGKIATTTETAAAGTTIQVATYGNGTSGQTVRSSICMAYRGTRSTIANAIVDSALNHESAPLDETVPTGSATATATTQWWVAFGNIASGGDVTAGSFTESSGTERLETDVSDASTSSGTVGYDSGATIAATSHEYSATWSSSSSRMNGAIVIIEKSAGAETEASAGVAGATAAALDATVDADDTLADAGAAAVTASALDATVSIPGSTQAAAEVAPATAAANNPTVSTTGGAVTANAECAEATAGVTSATTTAPAPTEEILPTNADWNIWIDWDKDLGVNLTSFETGTTEGWTGEGNPAPSLAVDLEAPSQPVKHGRRSMRVEWTIDTSPVTTPLTFGLAGSGFDDGSFQVNNPPVEGAFVSPTVERILTGLVDGRTYTASAWFYVPTGSPDVRLTCNGTSGSYTTSLDDWTQATVSFTASSTTHTLLIEPEVDPTTTTQKLYVETMTLTHTTEEIQDRVLGLRQSLSFKYGRDTARSLEAMSPTEATFELDNSDLELSPDNPDSIYSPYLLPGRPIYVRADWEDRFYSMFYGYLESYSLKPGAEDDSVEFGAQDMMSQLSDYVLDTEVHPSLQTGQAINLVLDAMGWPEHRRMIDHGATTVSWWFESGTDALEAVKRLVDSEGLPAFAYVDRHGNFVFRDRHHRYLDDRSLTPQATFWSGASDEEPQFCEPFEYDLGWTDLLNQVDFEVEVRQPRPLEEVFTMDEETVVQLKSGEAFTIDVEGTEPFIDAVPPIPGTVVVTDTSSAGEPGEEEEEVITPSNADFVIRTGVSDVTATLSRTSGATTKITFVANGGDATISNVRLRARPIVAVQTLRIRAEDTESVAQHGPRTYDGEVPWANVHDADAIARIIVGTRSERLPIVSFTVNSGNETRYLQVLERDLSDRIHLVEGKTFTDHDFMIESIEHNIDEVGWDHRATFSCERVKELLSDNAFEFGSATAGFDEGVFGGIGFVQPEEMFILGQSKLNQKKLTM